MNTEMSPGYDPYREVAATVAPAQAPVQAPVPPTAPIPHETAPTALPPFIQVPPTPPGAPQAEAKPKAKKTWLFVVLGLVVVLVAGGIVGAALIIKANREAAAARTEFAGGERAFAGAYNDWLKTSVDPELNWEETLTATGVLLEDMDSAVAKMAKAEKGLPGDAKGAGKKIVDQSQALSKDVAAVQSSLEDFSGSEDLDYDLTALQEQTEALSKAAAGFNEVVGDWNGLGAVKDAKGKTADDLEMTEIDDSWSDVLGVTEGTLTDRQDAFIADFIAVFSEAAGRFVEAGDSFMGVVNSLANTNPAAIPGETQATLGAMSDALVDMQEMADGLDEDAAPAVVTAKAAVVLDLAQKVASSAATDAATFNSAVNQFNTAISDLNAALSDYYDAADALKEGGDA